MPPGSFCASASIRFQSSGKSRQVVVGLRDDGERAFIHVEAEECLQAGKHERNDGAPGLPKWMLPAAVCHAGGRVADENVVNVALLQIMASRRCSQGHISRLANPRDSRLQAGATGQCAVAPGRAGASKPPLTLPVCLTISGQNECERCSILSHAPCVNAGARKNQILINYLLTGEKS